MKFLNLFAIAAALFVFAFCLTLSARSAEPAPAGTVDTGAVLRAGDRVEHVGGSTPGGREGGTWEASPESLISQAIEATPADDRDKWFVSLVTLPTCPPCKTLLKDWTNAEHVPEETLPMGVRKLRAIARPDPAEAASSWAHFLQFNAGDASQRARFAKIKVGPLPRAILQPPSSGKYGPSKDVVFIGSPFDPEYGGDYEKFAEAMLAAMRARVATFAPEEFERQEKAEAIEAPGMGPQPFDHVGAEALFPIFPDDQADKAPTPGILAKYAKSGGDWAIGLAYKWVDGKVGGWLGWILAGLGVLFVVPRVNSVGGWILWALKLWVGLGKGKPADQVDPDPASGPTLWARLQAALAALLAKAPDATPASKTTRKAAATRRKR